MPLLVISIVWLSPFQVADRFVWGWKFPLFSRCKRRWTGTPLIETSSPLSNSCMNSPTRKRTTIASQALHSLSLWNMMFAPCLFLHSHLHDFIVSMRHEVASKNDCRFPLIYCGFSQDTTKAPRGVVYACRNKRPAQS